MTVTPIWGTAVSKKLWLDRESKAMSAVIADTDRSLIGSGNNTKRLPVASGPTAQWLGATDAASPTNISWNYVDVTVDERLHSSFQISKITQKEAGAALVKKLLDLATINMARELDRRVLRVAVGYTSVTDEAVGSGDASTTEFPLDHAPVLEVSSVTVAGNPATNYTVDYYNGKLIFSVAPDSDAAIVASYAYADSNTYVTNVNTIGQLKGADIYRAISTMKARGFFPDFLILPHYGAQLLTSEVLSTYRLTEGTGKLPNMIGAIGDIRVLATDLLPNSYALLIEAPPNNAAVVKVHASDIEISKMERPDYARTDIFLDEWVKPVRVQPKSVEAIIGFASNAA